VAIPVQTTCLHVYFLFHSSFRAKWQEKMLRRSRIVILATFTGRFWPLFSTSLVQPDFFRAVKLLTLGEPGHLHVWGDEMRWTHLLFLYGGQGHLAIWHGFHSLSSSPPVTATLTASSYLLIFSSFLTSYLRGRNILPPSQYAP
jgi:hypothetical protein